MNRYRVLSLMLAACSLAGCRGGGDNQGHRAPATPAPSSRPTTQSTIAQSLAGMRAGSFEDRSKCASALVGLKEHAKPAVPELLGMLSAPDLDTVVLASWVLKEIDSGLLYRNPDAIKNLPRYREALRGQDDELAGLAVVAAASLREDGVAAIPDIIAYARRALEREPDVERRGWTGLYVAGSVMHMGAHAMPPLIDVMADERQDVQTRLLAGTLLNNFSRSYRLPDDVKRVMMKWLRGEHPELRGAAVEIAESLGPDAREAVPVLLASLRYNQLADRVRGDWKPLSEELRRLHRIAVALDHIDSAALRESPEGASLVPPLVVALGREPDPAYYAIEILGLIGPAATEGVRPLLKRSAEAFQREQDIPLAEGKAIKRIGRFAIPIVIEALSDADPAIRTAAAVALYRIAPTEPDVAAALQKGSRDPVQSVARWSRIALDEIDRAISSERIPAATTTTTTNPSPSPVRGREGK